MGQLNDAVEKFKANDTEVIVISPDPAKESAEFIAAAGIEKRNFTMLLDPEFRIIKRLMLFKENDVKGEAIPATFIIDKKGVLRFKFIPQHYSERPPIDHIFEILKLIQDKK